MVGVAAPWLRSGRSLCPIIEDLHFCHVRPYNRSKLTMGRVWQVGVTVGFAVEGQEETMGEAIGLPLDTDIGAPLEATNDIYFAGKRTKGIDNLLDLCIGRFFLELEEDNMA